MATGDLGFIEAAIRAELNKKVSDAVEEEIRLAQERIAVSIRSSVGAIVMSVLEYYDVQRQGKDVVIHVKHVDGR